MAATASEWPELEVALRALSAETGGGTLFVALMPPLVQVKSIQLPPVAAEDASRIISRGAGKYFVGAREAQVVGVRAEEGERGGPTMATASAASVRVIAAVRDAAEDAGWKIGRIVPAQSAWIAAADHVYAKSDALVDHGRIVVVDEDRTEVMFKSSGRPDGYRHLRGLGNDGEKLLELVAVRHQSMPASRNGMRPIAIIGDDEARRRLAPMLRDRGLHPLEPEGHWSRIMNSAALSAAHFAPLTEELELVTDEARSTRVEARNRLAGALGGVAAALFLGAFLVQYSGLRRELASVDARRSEIRQSVDSLLESERAIARLTAPISALDSIRTNSARFSVVLADVARYLPVDSYLTSLTARADSLNVSGNGKDAGLAIDGLRHSPSLANVEQAGNISRKDEIATFSLHATVRKEKRAGDGP
jgi:Tfp pilus assembly protein PilN